MLTNGHYFFRVLFSTVIRDILLILSTFFNYLWSRSENPLLFRIFYSRSPLSPSCPRHLIYCYLFLVVKAFHRRSSRDIQASAPRIAIYTALGQTTEIASSPYRASTCEAPYRNSPFPVSAYIGSGSSISELGRFFKRRILLWFLAKRGSCSFA